MKARLLQKLLNTERTCSNHDKYIAVGSAYVHDLISVNKETLEIKYALDSFREGRKSLLHKDTDELLNIWDKLQELIDSGQMKDIIENDDELEVSLPIFTVDDGELISTFTDKYGWPNVTKEGMIMYENTFFKTKKAAIEYGINDLSIGLKWAKENLEEKLKEIEKKKSDILEYESQIENLKKLL